MSEPQKPQKLVTIEGLLDKVEGQCQGSISHITQAGGRPVDAMTEVVVLLTAAVRLALAFGTDQKLYNEIVARAEMLGLNEGPAELPASLVETMKAHAITSKEASGVDSDA